MRACGASGELQWFSTKLGLHPLHTRCCNSLGFEISQLPRIFPSQLGNREMGSGGGIDATLVSGAFNFWQSPSVDDNRDGVSCGCVEWASSRGPGTRAVVLAGSRLVQIPSRVQKMAFSDQRSFLWRFLASKCAPPAVLHRCPLCPLRSNRHLQHGSVRDREWSESFRSHDLALAQSLQARHSSLP